MRRERAMTPPALSHSASHPMAASRPLSALAGRSCFGGAAAVAAWLAAAWLTAALPDLPDTDWAYTREFASLFATCAVALACVILAGIRIAVLRRLRRAAPWLLALALFFARLGGSDGEDLVCFRCRSSRRRRPSWKCLSTTGAGSARACSHSVLLLAEGFSSAQRRLRDRASRSAGREPSATGCIRSCASSARCRRRPGCRSPSSSSRPAAAPARS